MNYNIYDYPHLSVKISKLGRSIPTINLPARITCNPEAPCAKNGCYACKGNFNFQNVKTGLMRNLEAYKLDPEHYFRVIDYTLRGVPYKFFRYHSSGDIVDMRYFELMCEVAQRHKGTRFLCFTKKYDLVNRYLDEREKPENLVVVLSNWGEWKCPNPHNLPTAWVRLSPETEIPDGAMECSGYCGACVEEKENCWNLRAGESVVFKKH